MPRRFPSITRFGRHVRQTVRASLETIRSAVRVSHGSDSTANGNRPLEEPDHPLEELNRPRDEADHDPDGWTVRNDPHDGDHGHNHGDGAAVKLESRSQSRSTAALLDPDRGPTCRSEILEYGYTPPEYVRAILTEHGGRVKQRRFVDEYGWSPSTISGLLSELEDHSEIERFRIGREKVVRLADGN